jgi:predicted DCC family thiol-disulfide oxidoreductase YuxK
MVAAGSVSQRLAGQAPYSYRSDPSVPPFPDDRALLVFDGVCVLCSASARFILKRDHAWRFRFATAQSPLGQALFRHYGLDAQTFETNLLLVEGRAYAKLDTVVVAGSRRRLAVR